MQNKTEIIISPIFNQKKDFWQDFVRIEGLCYAQQGFSLSDEEARNMIQSFENQWKNVKCNFAFAAYNGAQMVGFANGYRENKFDMYLHNLCVDPKYQGYGIGTDLLKQSEKAAQLKTQNMTVVVSRPEEIGFYKKHGYTNYDNRNLLKKLSGQMVGPVPVFGSFSGLKPKVNIRTFRGEGFSKDKIKQYNLKRIHPLFVYVTPRYEIEAVAFRTPDSDDMMWYNDSLFGRQLEKALAKVR